MSTTKYSRLHSAIRVALLTTLCAVPALQYAHAATPGAQGEATTEATTLDAVVVTARAGTQTRTKAQTSYSLTRIDEERLRLQAPTSVTEAMKSVPGFWVEASGGEASGNIRARGIPVDGFGSVNLLEDGIPVQHDPALGYLNADQAFRMDETVERLEVVRGGPSSVFYSNAPAGVINFIPRVVGDSREGLFKYSIGDYGMHRLDFFYGQPLGDHWKMGLGGFYRIDDGIRSPGFRANDGGQVRLNLRTEFEGGSFAADLKHLDDSVMLYLGIPMRTNGNGDIRAVPGFDGNYGTLAGPETRQVTMLQGDGSLYDFDNSKGTSVKRDQVTAKLDLELGAGWQLAQSWRYSDTDTTRNGVFGNTLMGASRLLEQSSALLASIPGASALQLRYVNTPGQVFDTANQNGNGLVVIGGLRGVTMPLTEFGSDTRLMRKFQFGEQSHDLAFGYYFNTFQQNFDRYSSSVLLDVRDNARVLDLVAVDANGNALATLTDGGIWRYGYEWENAGGTSTTHAAYVSDEWQINERLRIDAGARWEQVNVRGRTQLKEQVNLGTLASSQIWRGTGEFADYDQTFEQTGWSLGGNYQFTGTMGMFVRWSSAFRLPNLSSYITSPKAKPIVQTMDLGEIGFKYGGRDLSLFATAFYTQYDNVGFSNYRYDPASGVSVVEQGFASTRTHGLELEGTWYPSEWFDLQATATWQDPQYRGLSYTELVAGAPVLRDFVGNQLIRVPKTSLRLVPGLNLLDSRLRLQLAYERQGERFVDTANTVRLPAYDAINFSARYDLNPQWTFYLYGDNLTNSLGLTEGNPRAGELQSSDAGANTFFARPLLGRSYRAAVMFRF